MAQAPAPDDRAHGAATGPRLLPTPPAHARRTAPAPLHERVPPRNPAHARRDRRDRRDRPRLRWPSWKRHRAYVQAVKRRRRANKTWPGRHPNSAAGIVLFLLMTPVWVSLGSALTNPALGLSVPGRAAEWLRDHGGASLVTSAENWWYTHHPPPVGGKPAPDAIPHRVTFAPAVSARATSPAPVPHLPKPPDLPPVASPPLQGEGVWTPAGRPVDGMPAVYTTFMRPDAVHTSVVDGIAWMDTKLLTTTLYSGSYIPGGGPFAHTAPVSPAAGRTLVAAFNAGFRMDEANGGYYTDGRVVMPLRTGAASFVIYRDGSVAIGAWGSDVKMTPQVAAVRQNLDLLVAGGRPVPGLDANDTTQWGFTLGNQVYVSRSGVGITADGALVYVGGPDLNITDLANLLVRAGAVRAMELDINVDWVNFATFDPSTPNGAASVGNATDLLPPAGMAGADRYFESWWSRDFFTLSARPQA